MQMGLYLHRQAVGVWRVVSEDSDDLHQSFLLIGCTGWIFTSPLLEDWYHRILSYSSI
jgi:hypothetical protein